MTTTNPYPIIDGHNDTLLHVHLSERGGGRSFFKHSQKGHLDLPRAQLGGFAGGFFAIFPAYPNQEQLLRENLVISETGYEVRPLPAIDPGYAQQFTMAVAAHLFQLEAEAAGQVKVVRTVDELRTCIETGTLAMILHFEGAEALDTDLNALEVFRSVNSDNTGMFTSCIRIDAVDASMTVGAAYYCHMEHAVEFDIIDVGRLTGNQSRVFSPLDRRSEHSCNTHLCTYPFSS